MLIRLYYGQKYKTRIVLLTCTIQNMQQSTVFSITIRRSNKKKEIK